MPDLPQTRQSLLVRLKDRSDDAWGEFLAIYEKSIIDFARRKGLQDADALDVTQEVLAAVESKVDRWKDAPEHGKFRGWLFRVARNIAVDKLIEKTRSPRTGGEQIAGLIEQEADHRVQETAEFWQDYRRQLMHWAARKVRPHVTDVSWNAFWMTAMEGKSASDVAETLGLSKGNVYAAKFRVTARLQKMVEKFADSAELELESADDVPQSSS